MHPINNAEVAVALLDTNGIAKETAKRLGLPLSTVYFRIKTVKKQHWDLWVRYRREPGNQELRTQLTEIYLPWVDRFFAAQCRGLSQNVDIDELYSAVLGAFIDAVDRKYDPMRGYLFSTFAKPVLRYAILSELRLQHRHVSRHVQLGGLNGQEAIFVEAPSEIDHESPIIEMTQGLPLIERMVLFLNFALGLTGADIGKIFGKSKTWAYNHRQSGLNRLRQQCKDPRSQCDIGEAASPVDRSHDPEELHGSPASDS